MYKAILFSRDGDWVTDYPSDSMTEVWDHVANQGSRWIFYPVVMTIKDHNGITKDTQRIVDCPDDYLVDFKGRTIKTVSKWLANLTDDQFLSLIGG